MIRKPHHQLHYDTGDKRIKEAAERAWRVLNPYHVLTPTDMKDMKWVPMGLTISDVEYNQIYFWLVDQYGKRIPDGWVESYEMKPFDNLGI